PPPGDPAPPPDVPAVLVDDTAPDMPAPPPGELPPAGS
ncbi:resuscitation-promoting factor RpfA, partial [Mycobacterium helveticum]